MTDAPSPTPSPYPAQVELSEIPAPSLSAPATSSSSAPEPSSIAIADPSPLAEQGTESSPQAVEDGIGGTGESGGGTESAGLVSDDAAPLALASSSTSPVGTAAQSGDVGESAVLGAPVVADGGGAGVADEAAAVVEVSLKDDSTKAAEAPGASGTTLSAILATSEDSTLPPTIVQPSPSALPPSSSLLASNSSSTTSTPVLAAAQLPHPTPSSSPAPTKKFASSLSVNKKFLEKAGDKGKPEVKALVTRLATPPIAPPISTTHPRLLTGKISSGPTVSLTTAQTVSGPSGWLKTAPAPEGQPRAPLSTQDTAMRGGTYERGRGIGGAGMGGAGRGSAVWGARGPGAREGNVGMPGGDFPTAAEAANAKTIRAAALVEQVQSRDRAVQARAAAAAAANATLLQGLDAFRGLHLDPNASHWDDMGDDNDDFLDTTIEFGDGTQYKIDADAPPPEAPSRSNGYLDEPHPSDLATLEAPLAPGESVHEPSREERFKDDYDRTWSKKSLAAEPAKNLFNERLGKFEPYGTGRKEDERKPPMPTGVRRPSATDLPPHLASNAHPHPSEVRPRRESITSPRLAKATLPPQAEPRAWGRDAGPGVRRPSMEYGARRPRIDQGLRRPVVEQGGRQLPPHLAGIAPTQPHRGLDRHEAPHRPSGPLSPTLSHPTPPSFSAFPPPSATLLPSKPSQLPPSPAVPAPAATPSAPVVAAAPAPPPAPVADLDELHAREMHAAAERAKKRRQEEEQVRAEQVERARKKAHELEEKAKAAAEAAASASKPAAAPSVTISAKSPAVAAGRLPPTGPSTDRAESWRDRARGPLPPAAVVAPPLPPLARPEPTHILARGVPPHLASRATQEPAPERAPIVRPAFVAAVAVAPTKPAEAATEPTIRPSIESRPAPPADERVWRRPDAPIVAPAATRQVPPHLAAELANRPEERSSRPVDPPARPATSTRTPTVAAVDAARPSTEPSTDPPTLAVAPPSPTPARRTPAPAAQPKAAAFKVPEMSVLEDLMSRIKGAMGAPKVASRDVAETVLRLDTSSPSLVPTVKLPAAKPSSVATAPRQPSASVLLLATLPVPDALEVVSKPTAIETEPKGKGRGRTEANKPVRSTPPFDNRDPLPLFESTRVERSQSPPPAWKAYVVRFPSSSKAIRPPHPRQVKAFFNVQTPLRVVILSWSPPIPNLGTRRLSRDDLLFSKQYRKGFVICPVNITKRRLVHSSAPPSNVESAASSAATPTPPVADSTAIPIEDSKRDTGRGPVNQRSWQRGGLPESVPEESVASSSVTPTVVDATSKASSDSELPVGSSAAFYSASSTPREEPAVAPVERADGMFMVTSALNGEVVEMTPRESLAAPGADALAHSLESSTFEPTPSTSAAAAPWSTAAPLSLSVLNPTAASVWSAPSADPPTHARSISLGGAQLENSLQGVADPDDFPSAIPNSLADLKSEDEGSSEGQAAPKRGAKDEARLRAAAPSFSSYNVPETQNSAPPRYPYIRQGPSQFQPAGSPVGYSSQPFLPTSGPPHSLHYPQPPSHLYPSFSISPQPSYSATPMHQSYSPNSFSSLPPSSQPPLFASYRPPQGITNPALLAQGYGPQMTYGAVGAGGGGGFGAVGAGGGSHGVVGRGGNFARSPSMAPGFLPGYVNGLGQPATYRDGFGMPQADGRSAFGGYPASPIQMSQHQHQPAHQLYPTQPRSYGGAFSPQQPNAHGPGVIGRGGGGQGQGRWQ